MTLRGVTVLAAGKIKAHYLHIALPAEFHRSADQFRREHPDHLFRGGVAVHIEELAIIRGESSGTEAHGADDDAILKFNFFRADAAIELGTRALEAAVHRAHHLLKAHDAAHMQLRREADLDIARAVGEAVQGQFIRGAFQRVRRLQYAAGIGEAAQILIQVRVAFAEHRFAEAGFRGAGKLHGSVARQLNEAPQAERAVQVQVQIGLGNGADEGFGIVVHGDLR
ncbi:MAG: hypothetical protein BWY76_03456 [bacterium ADurb.Bin429]|nr:MAG: hypothetical protein BWY76_03456 [bacterium ADurb.Bin429]